MSAEEHRAWQEFDLLAASKHRTRYKMAWADLNNIGKVAQGVVEDKKARIVT